MSKETKVIQLKSIADLVKGNDYREEKYDLYMNCFAPTIKSGNSYNIKRELLADYKFMKTMQDFREELLKIEREFFNIRVEFFMDFESPILEDLSLLIHSTDNDKFVNGVIKVFKKGETEETFIFNFTFESNEPIYVHKKDILDEVENELSKDKTIVRNIHY